MSGAEAAVVGGRVHFIPPKGILADLVKVAESKFRGGEFRYIDGSFKIPSTKRGFEIEVVVDDDCDVCPAAVEIVSEIAARHPNVTVKIFNISYVKPPFEPVTATPAFRINRRVRFTGIPLDPDGVKRYFSDFMKEAYVVTHPELPRLIERIRRFAETYGYRRNPNDNAYMNLLYKLLRNIDEYGHPYCPCRPLKKPPKATPEQIYALNRDKVCPCAYVHMDIKKRGHCLCGLFWTKEKVEEYVRKRLERYGWIIKELEEVQRALEELKKRVVSGRARVLAESIINKLQEVYVSLPD